MQLFGRQRYWGEPIPIYYKDGIPTPMDESELPLELPPIDKFQPTETGDPPLARATDWKYKGQYQYEYTTMPGWAGSSWYYLRYEDPNNANEFASKDAINYWQNIDLYIGGAEHSTGHLLYFRFWTKFLFDLGLVPFVEPAKKLVNQGMIQGVSWFAYRFIKTQTIISSDVAKIINGFATFSELKKELQGSSFGISIIELLEKSTYSKEDNIVFDYEGMRLTNTIRIPIEYVNDDTSLSREKLKKSFTEYNFFPNENGKILCFSEVEKMSKSKYNVVTPDDVIAQYGTDTMRMYEMFLGPLEMSKPWSTQGISGVHNFLRKFWKLFVGVDPRVDPMDADAGSTPGSTRTTHGLPHTAPSPAELKILHKTIKKIDEDIERLSFNTSVSAFMICLNELYDLKCNKRAILEPLVICLSPFAPHIAEELWSKLGHTTSVLKATYPKFEEKYLIENTFAYPVSFNGKTRFMLELPLNLSKEEIEKQVLASEDAKRWIKDSPIKKVIVVPNKIVNIVV